MTWMDYIVIAILLMIGGIVLFGVYAACWIQQEERRDAEVRHAEG